MQKYKKLKTNTLKDYRTKRGLSQRETAKRANIRAQTYTDIERGTSSPNLLTLLAILSVFDLDLCVVEAD